MCFLIHKGETDSLLHIDNETCRRPPFSVVCSKLVAKRIKPAQRSNRKAIVLSAVNSKLLLEVRKRIESIRNRHSEQPWLPACSGHSCDAAIARRGFQPGRFSFGWNGRWSYCTGGWRCANGMTAGRAEFGGS